MLTFDVQGQTLIRTDNFEPATDSVNYLMAKFAFRTDEWRTSNTKTAQFRLGETVYPAILDAEGKCIVPWEALIHGDSQYARKNGSVVHVSLIADSNTIRITTDEVPVKLKSSGYGTMGEPEEPTPDVYQQIMTSYGEMQAKVDTTMKTVGNAIKGVKTGAIVAMDDVSPFSHRPVVKVWGKNLIPYPYDDGSSVTRAGVTFTANADGGITVTGTGTQNTSFNLVMQYKHVLPIVKGKTYTLSCVSTLTEKTGYVYFQNWKDGAVQDSTSIRQGGVTFTASKDGYGQIGLVTLNGVTYNETIYVQLEEGNTATEYTPWVDPTDVTIIQCGKNLLRDTAETETINGVTFTANSDGTIKVTGTTTAVTTYFIGTASARVVKGEKYILSGCPAGGSTLSGYALRFYDGNGKTPCDTGDGVEIEWTDVGASYNFAITIRSGVTMNHTFKPMLRHASIKDGTYEQYHVATDHGGTDGVTLAFSAQSPNMTFLTEVEGVMLECEYNRDATKALGAVDLAPFIVNMTLNGTTIASIDKTYADTLAAFMAGRLVECRVNAGRDGYYTLPPVRVYGADGIIFGSHSGNTGTVWTTVTFLDNDTATFTTS